jgi:hypothetical protein
MNLLLVTKLGTCTQRDIKQLVDVYNNNNDIMIAMSDGVYHLMDYRTSGKYTAASLRQAADCVNWLKEVYELHLDNLKTA